MNSQTASQWITDRSSLLPDFIIGGAMKSGTSTLHTILAQHPEVFIPDTEVHFFDIDNLFQHRDFIFYNSDAGKWTYQIIHDNTKEIWDWYLSKFEDKENYLTGEDSTTYLASKVAAKRISMQKKDIKLIFLLRHPTERAYSQYHHMLRSGRAIYSFEDTIKYNPASILKRSLYKRQLEHYYANIPRENIKVVLFEDFVDETAKTVSDICNFLDISFQKFDKRIFNTHSHKAKIPLSATIQIVFNRIYRFTGKLRHLNSLPATSAHQNVQTPLWAKGFKKLHRFLNPLWKSKKPPINESTKAFLDTFFFNKLKGIDELVDRDIMSVWFSDHVKT